MLGEDGCNQKIWINENNKFNEITYLELKTKKYLKEK
jgi:hypothetical protein